MEKDNEDVGNQSHDMYSVQKVSENEADFKKTRECHGFINPCRLASRVVMGAGVGWVFVTPA